MAIASMLKSALANPGADLKDLRLNSRLSENDIAQTIGIAANVLDETKAFEALALIRELAELERDSNDEFGDVILDGTTDIFDRIRECAKC